VAKKEKKIKSPDSMVEIRFTLSAWHHEKLKAWAKENGMSGRAALRYLVNQHFKGTSY
jgi:hypothetical protein